MRARQSARSQHRLRDATKSRSRCRVFCLLAALLAGCSGKAPALDQKQSAIVYGPDDRKELLEVQEPERRARIEGSVAAIVPKDAIEQADGFVISAPAYGALADLCPGEPFAEQPAAALCTGVLVESELVLTAAHCVHVFRRDELAVVFGYYYDDQGRLAIGDEDVLEIADILDEALDPPSATPRLDYAWLRLSRPVGPGREPAPMRVAPSSAAGDPLVYAGASGGVPLKVDEGAVLRDPRRSQQDYFVASSDSSAGGSGGPAFDSTLAVLGILARGGPDLVESVDGCNATVHESDSATPQEQFTYAARALEGLCQKPAGKNSSLCRASCGDPCAAAPPAAPLSAAGGCSFARSHTPPASSGQALLAFVALVTACCGARRSKHATSR